MRQTIILLLAAMTAMSVSGRSIDSTEAQSIATEFFNSGPTAKKSSGKAMRLVQPASQVSAHPAYYIFNADDNRGFVIVSGDDRTQRILGYSDKGRFDADKMPPQLAFLLDQYQKAIESIHSEAPASSRKITRSEGHEPLLDTQWGQGYPYNEKCPIIGGVHAVTGCVATAMAQVINYEKKTSHVNAIPEYWCDVYMPGLPEYDFNFGDLDNDGIATLMLYCGQSVRMGYGAAESGSSPADVPYALSNYFGWDSDVRLLSRDDYNDEHWNRMVREEIEVGHPLIYSAVSETSGWHAFVVDGFTDQLFHVNWGWDGYMDGYYSFQPMANDNRSEFIHMQWMIATRDDDPSADIITYGTTIDGINYQLDDNHTAAVLPLKNGEKYRGRLVIPSHVTYEGKTYTVNYFGPNAFTNCKHLEYISIPETIEGQAWSIFEGCDNLHKVNVEDMAAFIRLEAGGWPNSSPLYYGGDLYLKGELVKDLVIPEGIESVGYCKFRKCWSIESITMPSTFKKAGQYAFADCPNLKNIDMMGSSLEILGDVAFVNCTSIQEVRLPPTLKSMEDNALGQVNGEGCKKLRKIVSLATTPPWSVSNDTFEELHYSDAVVYVPDESLELYRQAKEWHNFLDILPLSEEKPFPQTTEYCYDGITYEINLTDGYAKIISGHNDGYNPKILVIPSTIEYESRTYPVEVVGYEALSGNNIDHIEAPLKKIGIRSFTYVGFWGDKLEIPKTLKTIPTWAFRESTIPYLVLHDNIISIGDEAFDQYIYEGLEHANVLAVESQSPYPPAICDNAFGPKTYNESPLYVPYGSKKLYASADGWCNFKNILNIGEEQESVYNIDLTMSASIPDNIPVRNKMPMTVTGTIRNSGLQKSTGFTLSWEIDGKHLGEKHFDTGLNPDEILSFEEKITAKINYAGTHQLKLSVANDGEEDQELSDNTVELSFESFDNGYYRVSLIEQFTSEECAFTPMYGPRVIDGIKNSGKEDFVAHVMHHCGFYDDFLTVNRDYEWFYNDWGTYTPAMMINRTDINGTGYTPISEIPEDVDRKIINEFGLCNALVSVYNEVGAGKATVKLMLEKDEDFDMEAGYDYLTVFLIEDNIPARAQRDPWSDQFLDDYIHRNALRKVLSDPWGDNIEWKGNDCAFKYETEIDPSWNADNLKAVAFIHRYDPTSPIASEVYTANSSDLPQYGKEFDERLVSVVVEPTGISFNPTSLNMAIGEQSQLEVTFTPDNTTKKKLTWISSNPAVATVTDGLVSAVGHGDAVITATTTNGLTASCKVHVIPDDYPESISLDMSEITIYEGDSQTLTATIYPSDVTHNYVAWSSSDMNVAFVDANGTVTGVSGGYSFIMARTENGLQARCKVQVIPVYPKSVYLNPKEIEINTGESQTLTATIYPSDVKYNDVTWSSSNPDVATVDDNGTVTGVAQGDCIIIVTTANSLEATCEVTVHPIYAEAITLNVYDAEVVEGETLQLTAVVSPENATFKEVVWSSSDESVATVDSTGLVTVVKPGSVDITASASDGSGASATCHINALSGVEAIFAGRAECDVYTVTGILVRRNATRRDLERLTPDVYILRRGATVAKVHLR